MIYRLTGQVKTERKVKQVAKLGDWFHYAGRYERANKRRRVFLPYSLRSVYLSVAIFFISSQSAGERESERPPYLSS